MKALKSGLRWVLARLYRVEVFGEENLQHLGERVMVVANHTSFLDAALLYAFLPLKMTFAVNTYVSRAWYFRLLNRIVEFFPLDPANPLSIRALIKRVTQGGNVVIFPEGRITVTGALMKIYQGPGLVADKTGATLLPVRIDGAQYTPFSRLKGRVRLRWRPSISLTVLPSRSLKVPEEIRGRDRRKRAGRLLSDIMTEMMFRSSNYQSTLFNVLLDARKIHGGEHVIAEDVERRPLTYDALLTRTVVLGRYLAQHTDRGDYVGVLLPGALSTVVTFCGLQLYGRIPAMLNYTVGAQGMISACETAQIKVVITARAFVSKAKLDDAIAALENNVNVIYLEDAAKHISVLDKLAGALLSRFDYPLEKIYGNAVKPNDPAVVLFTSGSEGTPKGVVLSHTNLLANIQQLTARIDFNAQDVALNCLPMFHSFGLTAGTLLPLLSGIRTFFYPSPLHYRVIPEVAYDINATILFGTNTFLAGYARFAHPYDFYSVRYVFAGAEKLKDEVRRLWEEKFGVRIFEGYGATETSPVIAGNTPMDNRPGTVGRLLPTIDYHLASVPGLAEGARLHVRGPNVMLGYLLHENPGQLVPPRTELGDGWYDTGDIVRIDDEGYVQICGRAKRFAKVAGEMVSLTTVESLASKVWPDALHAAIAVPHESKGEQVVLLTNRMDADRGQLISQAQQDGVGELSVPRKIVTCASVPVLGTGKIDYVSAQSMAEEAL